MENNTNKPSFLEELGQSVRTKDEVAAENNRVAAERKVRAEIEADRQMNETVNQWIEKIKKEITERAKNGEFESVWGRKRISGKFSVPGMVSWSNEKRKRKTPLLLMLLGGFFTFGLTWALLGDNGDDIHFVTTMTGSFSQKTQKYIMHLKKRMSEEGIAFNDLHINIPSMWWGADLNQYQKVNGEICCKAGSLSSDYTPVKIAGVNTPFEAEVCHKGKSGLYKKDEVSILISYSVEF